MHYKFKLLPILVFLLPSLSTKADNSASLIFKGVAGESASIDLSDYYRIKLNDDSFIILPYDKSLEAILLSYSDFNYFNFQDSDTASLDLPQSDINISECLKYDKERLSLLLSSNSDKRYEFRIFNINGSRIYENTMSNGEIIDLSELEEGVYIAHAMCDSHALNLKFIR
ncbi:MAG: T9SS type A sorting domain-containing protein [Bacteroides sp.]|nr:T9SS type A sorting domain-containing protein [Bacteroides sp.]